MTNQQTTDIYDAALELSNSRSSLDQLVAIYERSGLQLLAEHTRQQIARNNVAIAKLKAVVAEECEGVAR